MLRKKYHVLGILYVLSSCGFKKRDPGINTVSLCSVTGTLQTKYLQPQKISYRLNINECLGKKIRKGSPLRTYTEAEFEKLLQSKKYLAQIKSPSCHIESQSEIEIQSLVLENDPLSASAGHLKNIQLSEANDILANYAEVSMQNVVIAVIDTGVDLDHEDLRENIWTNPGENPSNGIDDDENGYIDDVNGYNFSSDIGDPRPQGEDESLIHGTHVAGLAAAEANNGLGLSGSNGNAKIMALNIFGKEAYTNSTLLENSIRYAADNGAHVINLSLGGLGYSSSIEDAVDYALSKGLYVVTASGNESVTLSNNPKSEENFYTPASLGALKAGMITVGSVDSNNNSLSYFSNTGENVVEMMAPGSDNSFVSFGILSTYTDNSYERLEGTSMSSPIVSGVLSLTLAFLKSQNISYTQSSLEKFFLDNNKSNSVLEGHTHNAKQVNMKYILKAIEDKILTPGLENVPEGDPTKGVKKDELLTPSC